MYEQDMPPFILKEFIMPGSHFSAVLHLAHWERIVQHFNEHWQS